MEQRKIINEKVDIRIEFENEFSHTVTFKNLKEAKGIEDGDEVLGITIRHTTYVPWGSNDDGEVYDTYPVIVINRPRPETDDEFYSRVKKEETIKKNKEEEERLLYLRLKAKFEPNE